MKRFASNLNLTTLALGFFLLAGCQNTGQDTGIISVQIESGTADGTGSSVVASGQTSVLVKPVGNATWKDFTVDLGSDFSNTNICSGRTIFGRSGSALCVSDGTNTAATDVLAGTYFWNSAGASTLGTMTNHGALNINTTAISGTPSGYYSSITSTLTASDLCTGKSIFGSAGIAVCNSVFSDLTASNMYRNVATAQMTLTTETSTTSYASGYRNVPDIYKDDDGYFDSTKGCGNSGGYKDTCTSVVKATRPSVTCGTTQATVSARIAHCLTQNGANATWTGSTKGTSGEGTWKLVTRTSGTKEVWRDERTGLVWSDIVGNDNWCKASGNGLPNDERCNGNTSSYCAEGGSLTPAIVGENWTTGVYNETKGGMGAVATGSSPSVIWRLATRNDWLQAEINGVRFVLPNMLVSLWCASVYSTNRDVACLFNSYNGSTGGVSRFVSMEFRCLGR